MTPIIYYFFYKNDICLHIDILERVLFSKFCYYLCIKFLAWKELGEKIYRGLEEYLCSVGGVLSGLTINNESKWNVLQYSLQHGPGHCGSHSSSSSSGTPLVIIPRERNGLAFPCNPDNPGMTSAPPPSPWVMKNILLVHSGIQGESIVSSFDEVEINWRGGVY
jgi:hypothetical protein